MSIISTAPYYDRYDSSKQYTQLLAVPGRVAQAREITEIQSTMKDIIRSLGDSIMQDGNIIEGCQVIPDKVNKKVTVTEGKVYMHGMVLPLAETSTDIAASGSEIIGVKLKETIVYATGSSGDSTLLDPALGFENYNQPGCDRLKSELEVVNVSNTDDSIAVLATLVNGELYTAQQAPNYSKLDEVLAGRTYDESGSYLVNGLNVRVVDNPEDTGEEKTTFNIVVEKGKAYVYGYQREFKSSMSITMPRATTTSVVSTKNTDSGPYRLVEAPYVKSIISVVGIKKKEIETTMSSEYFVTTDNSDVVKITAKNSPTTVYVKNTDYKVDPLSGGQKKITWLTALPGVVVIEVNYSVNFSSSDYTLSTIGGDAYLTLKETPASERVPNSELVITFNKYLARKDIVYISEEGQLSVIQGTPAEYGLEIAPDAPTYSLPLATISSPPGGTIANSTQTQINVSNVGLTRFTMKDIHDIVSRIRTIEYDQTILSLNTEAKEYGSTGMKGIFTDPFIDLSKVDLTFNKTSTGKINQAAPTFDATIDLDGNLVYLPLLVSMHDATYVAASSTVNKYNRVATLQKSNSDGRVVLSQSKANKSYKISPYLTYNQSPEIFLSPSLDTWYEDSIIEIPKSLNTTEIVSDSLRHIYTKSGKGSKSKVTTNTTTKTTSVGSTVDTVIEDDVISEEAVVYIRERDITVEGSNFPYATHDGNKITCYFEGVKLDLTPVGDTVSGGNGTVKAKADGSFKATFKIPKGKFLTGTRLVTLKSGLSIEGIGNSAVSFYQATGTARTLERTITTITTVLMERITTVDTHTTHYDPDPLAQTFILDSMTLLSGIDIYFENVPTTTNAPVTCEIREVSNGNITSTIYGFKTLMANDIRSKVSEKGTIPTRFNFNDPVLIEANKEYAFVLKSSSSDYRVFVAELGGDSDYISGETILSNPYLLGVMMSSSNNSSWTTHQNSDVKFNLIADNYALSSEVVFDTITPENPFCRLYLTAETIIPDKTNITWLYSLDNGSTYNTITTYSNIVFTDSLKSNLKLKAILTRDSSTLLTPILAIDSVSVSLESYDNSSDTYYVSNQITGLDDYNKVEIILDTEEQANITSLTVYVSPDASISTDTTYNKVLATNTATKIINNGWKEKTYQVSLSEVSNNCRLLIKLHSDYGYKTPAFRRLRAIMSKVGS